jgi:hypothetical protein
MTRGGKRRIGHIRLRKHRKERRASCLGLGMVAPKILSLLSLLWPLDRLGTHGISFGISDDG